MDEITKTPELDLSMGQTLGKVVISAGAGFLASELAKKAFDMVVKEIRKRKEVTGS